METEQDYKDYIDGYNNGYLLRKFEPELAKTLISSVKENHPYIQGMKDGKARFETELDKDIKHGIEQHNKMTSQKELDKTADKGKDDI
ncbi:MAG: hypothetical protein RLP14_02605 [Owenweeksia sp.]